MPPQKTQKITHTVRFNEVRKYPDAMDKDDETANHPVVVPALSITALSTAHGGDDTIESHHESAQSRKDPPTRHKKEQE